MSNNKVKREERHAINTLMVYSDMNSTSNYSHAKLYNFNRKGLYFETPVKLLPDSEIIVEITNYMPGPYSPEGSDAYYAKVKWCDPTEDLEGYAVGAEITGNHIGNKKVTGNPCDFPFNGVAH